MFNSKFVSALGALITSVPALAFESRYNMPVGVTPVSHDIYALHMSMFWVCCAIAAVVFGAMIYSLIKFRKSAGAIPDKTLLHSTKLEAVWTTIPVFILIALAIPAARTLVTIEDTRNADLTVKVTGYQWKWQYEYLGKDISFYSTLSTDSNEARQLNSGIDVNTVKDYLRSVDHPLVVPVGAKVRLLLTGNDVIHSWWMPDFGVKKDAIPGFINEAWFKALKVGHYTGQCTELCGRDHGFMPIAVDVLSKEDFERWVTDKQAASQAAATAMTSQATASTVAAP
jgi:cytochrome c oxidase subunit 2